MTYQYRKSFGKVPVHWDISDGICSGLRVYAAAMVELAIEREEALTTLAHAGMVSENEARRMLACPPPEGFLRPLTSDSTGEPCQSSLCPWCYGSKMLQGLDELGVLGALMTGKNVAFFQSRLGFNGQLNSRFKHLFIEVTRKEVRKFNRGGRYLFRVSTHPAREGQFQNELVVAAVTNVLPDEVDAATKTESPKLQEVSRAIVSCDGIDCRFWGQLTEGFSFPTHALCSSSFTTADPGRLVQLMKSRGRLDQLSVCDAATDSDRQGTRIIPWWWYLVRDAG